MIRRKSDLFSKKSVRTRSSATAPSFFRLAHPLHLFPQFPKRPTKMRAGRKGGFRGEFRPALHLVFAFLLFRAIFSFLLFCSAGGFEPSDQLLNREPLYQLSYRGICLSKELDTRKCITSCLQNKGLADLLTDIDSNAVNRGTIHALSLVRIKKPVIICNPAGIVCVMYVRMILSISRP